MHMMAMRKEKKNDMATLNAEHINPFLMAAKKVVSGYVFCSGSDTETWFKRGELW